MRRIPLAILALLLAAAPAPAQTAKALELVPDDALGFVLVNDLRQLSDKVEALANKLKVPQRVSLLELIQQGMGLKDGLNDKGSVAFIVLKGEKGDKDAGADYVVALPVADHDKMARALGVKQSGDGIHEGEAVATSSLLFGIGGSPDGKGKKDPVLVAKKGDFVLLASPKSRATLERLLKASKSVAAAVKPAHDWMAEQDVSGVCTHHGVKAGLAMIIAGPGGAAGRDTEGQYASMKATYADIEKNVKLLTFGARIEKEGHPRLLARVYFEPDGEYAKWIAKAAAVQGKGLTKMPSQQYVFAALARLSPQTSFEGLTKALVDGLAPEDKAKQLSLETARLLRRISEVGLGVYKEKGDGKGAGVGAAAVVAVDDAPKFVEEAVDLFKKIHRASSAKAKDEEKVELQYQERKVAGKPSRLITATPAKVEKKEGDKAPEQQKPSVLLLTELDSRTVLACQLSSADEAEAAVKRFSAKGGQPLSKDESLQKTAVLLPPQRQVEAYLNLQVLGLFGVAGVASSARADAPPLGFALSTFPGGVEAQFVIPFGTLQALFEGAGREKESK